MAQLDQHKHQRFNFNGPRRRTRNITRWQSSDMVLRWAAASLLEREERYNRFPSYKQLWRLLDILKNLGKPSATKRSSRKPF